MELPPFSDFQMTMTDDHIREVFSDLKHSELITLYDGPTPENMDALYNRLIQIAVNASFKAQVVLLQEYHEWLRGCLEKNPGHQA